MYTLINRPGIIVKQLDKYKYIVKVDGECYLMISDMIYYIGDPVVVKYYYNNKYHI